MKVSETSSSSIARSLLLVLGLGVFAEAMIPSDAFARAGRGRSMGRSYSSPSRPANTNNYSAPTNNGYYNRQGQPPLQPNGYAKPSTGGSVAKGVAAGAAAGVAGAVVGNMLYNSVGNAASPNGAAAAGTPDAAAAAPGDATGSFAPAADTSRGQSRFPWLVTILALVAGYLGFRWWKNRQRTMAYATAGGAYAGNGGYTAYQPAPVNSYPSQSGFRALTPEGINADDAQDIFFRIQGAWTRRDLNPVRQLLGREVQETMERDIEELKQQKLINRLENISVRRTEILSSWQDEGLDLTKVRFTANLLDYTVDEQSGRVTEGSDSNPVKFEEDWTFAKSPRSNDWQLVAIQQV